MRVRLGLGLGFRFKNLRTGKMWRKKRKDFLSLENYV